MSDEYKRGRHDGLMEAISLIYDQVDVFAPVPRTPMGCLEEIASIKSLRNAARKIRLLLDQVQLPPFDLIAKSVEETDDILF